MCVAQVNDVPPLISVQFFCFHWAGVFEETRHHRMIPEMTFVAAREWERERLTSTSWNKYLERLLTLPDVFRLKVHSLWFLFLPTRTHIKYPSVFFPFVFFFFFRDYYIAKSWHSDIFMGRQVHWTLPGYSLLESCVWLLHAQDADGVAVGCVFTGSGEKRERTTRGNEPIRWTLATTDCFDKKRPFSGRRRAWM